MGSTNFTPNYNLPQFIGTDKPAWLTDVNTAFSNIDTAIKNAADDASSAVSTAGSAASAAGGAVNSVNTLDGQINTPGTGLAAQVSTLATTVTNQGTKIGTAVLDTVAQDLSGAVNELKSDIPSTTNILKFTGTSTIVANYNGSKTMGQAMDELYAALANVFAALGANDFIRICKINVDTATYPDYDAYAVNDQTLQHTMPGNILAHDVRMSSSVVVFNFIRMFGSGSNVRQASTSLSVNDISSTIVASGSATITIERYTVLQ